GNIWLKTKGGVRVWDTRGKKWIDVPSTRDSTLYGVGTGERMLEISSTARELDSQRQRTRWRWLSGGALKEEKSPVAPDSNGAGAMARDAENNPWMVVSTERVAMGGKRDVGRLLTQNGVVREIKGGMVEL